MADDTDARAREMAFQLLRDHPGALTDWRSAVDVIAPLLTARAQEEDALAVVLANPKGINREPLGEIAPGVWAEHVWADASPPQPATAGAPIAIKKPPIVFEFEDDDPAPQPAPDGRVRELEEALTGALDWIETLVVDNSAGDLAAAYVDQTRALLAKESPDGR